MIVEKGMPISDSVITDYGHISQEELDKEQGDGVKPRNKYTPAGKLQLSLTMAESLAEMHGYVGGVIAHHDISFEQWLWDAAGNLKLNDFNKAKLPPWNVETEEYCTFWSSQDSVYRAPEEMEGGETDESADVVSFGKIMYTIMTGLIPYYEKQNTEEAYKAIINGELPYIDPRYRTRSMIEGRLVEIMERTWQFEKKDRVDIFEVVRHLRQTAKMAGIDFNKF